MSATTDPGVVAWTFPVDTPLTLAGQPLVKLTVQTSAPDAEVAARLWDLSPDGKQTEERLDQSGHVDAAVGRLEVGLLDLLRRAALDVHAVELLLGRQRGRLVVEARDQRPRQRTLRVAGAQLGGRRLPEQQPVIGLQRRVRDAQQLAVDLRGRLRDADVVVERLGHAPLAVSPRQDRQRHDGLLGLPVGSLHVAAEQ